MSTHQCAQQLAQPGRFSERCPQSFKLILAVDHHRAALKPTVVAVVTEANPVCARVVRVLEQLNRRLGVLPRVRRLLNDLPTPPVKLELPRHCPPALTACL